MAPSVAGPAPAVGSEDRLPVESEIS
jgi:hypothetical protein